MSYLQNVVSGKLDENELILLYGPEGVGKTTFGAQCDKAIFLASEKGTSRIDVERLPALQSWSQTFEMLEELAGGNHDYQTLVIDTLDWLEPFMYDHLLEVHNKKVIEEVGGGYGKWVGVINAEWRKFMGMVDLVRTKMDVVVLAHSQVKAFNDPMEVEAYDRYQLKLHSQSACALWKEYVDCLLFANYKVFIKKDKGIGKTKALGDGDRTVYTTRMPAYDAKNNAGLDPELEMDGSSIMSIIKRSNGETSENVADEITMLLDKVNDVGLLEVVKKSVVDANGNYARLVALRSRLVSKLGE